MAATPHTSQQPAATTARPAARPSVRQLIAELAATEDDLREVRSSGLTERSLATARRQACIVRELRRRRFGTR